MAGDGIGKIEIDQVFVTQPFGLCIAVEKNFGLFGLQCGLASELTKFRTDLLRLSGPDGPDNEPGSPAPADPLHRNAAGVASGIRRHVRFVRKSHRFWHLWPPNRPAAVLSKAGSLAPTEWE
jgi:hypothetical protein